MPFFWLFFFISKQKLHSLSRMPQHCFVCEAPDMVLWTMKLTRHQHGGEQRIHLNKKKFFG